MFILYCIGVGFAGLAVIGAVVGFFGNGMLGAGLNFLLDFVSIPCGGASWVIGD